MVYHTLGSSAPEQDGYTWYEKLAWFIVKVDADYKNNDTRNNLIRFKMSYEKNLLHLFYSIVMCDYKLK